MDLKRLKRTHAVNSSVCSGTLSFEDMQAGCILYTTNGKIYVVTAAHALKMQDRLSQFESGQYVTCNNFHSRFPTDDIEVNFQCNDDSFKVEVVNFYASGLFIRLADWGSSGSDWDWDWVMLATNHSCESIPSFIKVLSGVGPSRSGVGPSRSGDGGFHSYFAANHVQSYIYLPDGTVGLNRNQWVPGYSGCYVSRGMLTMETRMANECINTQDSMWGIATTLDVYVIHANWSNDNLLKVLHTTWNTNNRLGLMLLPMENALAKPWGELLKLQPHMTPEEKINVFVETRFSVAVAWQIISGKTNNFGQKKWNFQVEDFGNHFKMCDIMEIDSAIFFVAGASYTFKSEKDEVITCGMFAMANVSDDGNVLYACKKGKPKGQIHGEVLGMCKVIYHYLQNFASGSVAKVTRIEIYFHMDGRKGRPNKPCDTCVTEIESCVVAFEDVVEIVWD